jgi:hypothetical protein
VTWSWSVSIQPTFTKDPEKRICRSGHLDKTDDDGREMAHAPDAEDERVTVTSSARPGLGPVSQGWQTHLHDEPARHHRPRWQVADALPPGQHTIVFDWKIEPTGEALARGATGMAQSERPPSRRLQCVQHPTTQKKIIPTPALLI